MNPTYVAVHLLVTGSVLVLLVLAFVVFFLWPALLHWRRLKSIQAGLSQLSKDASVADFRQVFAQDESLAHHWKEYQDTLHIQKEVRGTEIVIAAVRSTVPAEMYFNSQYVVDSRLRTEFFKHFPGIFTGIGIIGTFTGLIDGLRRFQVSENAATVRASLESLMHSVGEAFLISALAIAAAMVVTFVEKLILAALYGRTEEIAHTVDAQFDSGAGEEYMSRLVRASEDAASQAKILKDGLITGLGDILRELSAAQIASAQEGYKQLGTSLVAGFKDSVEGPLQDIASTVKIASGDQSATAVRLLQDVMTSFSERLNDLFGGQISGINQLNKETGQAMQEAVGALHTLVAKLEDSGKRSVEEMADKMAAAISAMEERQRSINQQTQEFVEDIRKLVDNSQTQTQSKLQVTLDALGQQMTGILSSLGQAQAQADQTNANRQRDLEKHSKDMTAELGSLVQVAVQEMREASSSMARSVSSLADVTRTSVDKMHTGAEKLSTAAVDFATAGDRVNGVMTQVGSIGTKLSELSGSLTTSAGSLGDALRDYRTQRGALEDLLANVRAVVDLARKEASLTSDVLQRIETATTKLGQAQQAADTYLDGVSKVLANSSDAFRESVTSTLAKVNHDFHTKLSNAVGLLSTSIQELEATLGSVTLRN